MRTYFVVLVSLAILGASTARADPDCTCRAAGVEATIGQTVCLSTPNGMRLARCEMVLNNTSWTFLDGACPEAHRATRHPQLAMSAKARALPLD